jgi:hypothetical protein
MDRPTAAKVIADLTKFADWEPADSPRAIAMRDAAEWMRQFAPRHGADDPLDDPALQARSYAIETHAPTKTMRFSIYRENGQKGLLGYTILESPEIYELGTDLIKRYDKLEGID